jgi:hypothetical protein
MGRTEFLPQRLEVSPGWKAQTTHESEMALFSECMQECARKVLDTADIVRDGDFATVTACVGHNVEHEQGQVSTRKEATQSSKRPTQCVR